MKQGEGEAIYVFVQSLTIGLIATLLFVLGENAQTAGTALDAASPRDAEKHTGGVVHTTWRRTISAVQKDFPLKKLIPPIKILLGSSRGRDKHSI